MALTKNMMSSNAVVDEEGRRFDVGLNWVVRVVGVIGALLCVVLLSLAGNPIIHGHPAYWVALALTFIVSVAAMVRTFWSRRTNSTARRIGRSLLVVLSIGWLAIVGWLMPAGATDTALQALASDSSVTVVDSPTQVALIPSADIGATGFLFQPGAKVDARAYVSALRPLALAGHVVVIAKQPLGIAFLATNAIDSARSEFPDVSKWVVGGHSLGGTVAALQAAGASGEQAQSSDSGSAPVAPIVGLVLFASYPAADMSDSNVPVLSLSGEKDGLSTPDAIAASKPSLPSSTTFIEVPGANHASFGDYGIQFGDGVATASLANAHAAITKATLDFVNAH
ncbi:MAG: alpha/beta hydrolase [Actinobacteria bacterium]|nr:alpha/beta hydrolase [Actinomycetota bacterium]